MSPASLSANPLIANGRQIAGKAECIDRDLNTLRRLLGPTSTFAPNTHRCEDIKLLTIAGDGLGKWCRLRLPRGANGAHAMSQIAGIGVDLAAGIRSPRQISWPSRGTLLMKVTQRMQALVQRNIISSASCSTAIRRSRRPDGQAPQPHPSGSVGRARPDTAAGVGQRWRRAG